MAHEAPFLPFGVLAKLNMFPRFGTPMCQTRPRSSFDAARTLFVVLSHRWLSPSEDPQHSHPDLPFNGSPKLKLLMELLTRIKLKLPPDFQIAVWMDWMCLEQSTDTASELGDTLHGIIASSDLLVSIVYDSEHQKWKYPEMVTDWLVDYKAQAWNGSSESHWQRAWCRLEASISAVTPLPTDDEAWKQKCKALEHHALGYMMKCGRRPHILFGTKEMSDKRPLIVLPPMLEQHLRRYAPRLATRNITLKGDAAVIMQYSQRLEGAPPVVQPGMVELDGGRVQVTDEDGAIYTGGWEGSAKNGSGEMVFADGNVYDGEWANGEMHGKGKYLFATGDVYEGEFKEGRMQGSGMYNWADGYVYDGEWSEDKMHGNGTFALNNGFSVVTLFSGKWWHGSST